MTKCMYLATLLVHLVLPAALLLSIAVRPFGLSIIYLLLYLIAPLSPVPHARTDRGRSTKFLKLTLALSIILLLVHVIWHIVLAAFSPYGSLLVDYPIIQKIGQNLGLVSYHEIDPLMAVHYLVPELVMTGTSLVVHVAVRKLLAVPLSEEDMARDSKNQQFPLLVSAGKYICLIFIMFSGIMRPSVTSGLYFLVFMGAATAWSVGRPLERGFAVVGRCLMAMMAVHVGALLVYQCTWLVALYPPDMDMARYFGLTKLVNINETDPSEFSYDVTENYKWATLASPIIILVTYFLLALETRELFKPKVAYSYINSQSLRGRPSENTPLIRTVSPSRRWSVRSRSKARKLRLDSTGSVVVPQDEESMMDNEKPTLADDIIAAIIDFFQVLVRSSYIATTITMMAWSIMYHSWLGFVFLMWANIVWLCQDQRSFMLKTSPLLVLYAMFLLLAEYVYGMDLLESELPSKIDDVNLQQIGLGRSEREPCVPLLIKSLFTCMFWVTLRQRVQEVRERRRSAAITDMAAPLQLTVSTAASVIEERREEETRSRLIRIVGDFLRAMCARYWIYVVVIMLFVIGITGTRMTIFRIVYMFLFLGFILMFQISWYWWRRLMYAFWITLIIYSMINLILVYIYQFDNFSKIIAHYLGINERLQHDLGLEPYQKADLFVKLLTPTCFLIITIMQVHYFHKDFMALSDPISRASSMRMTSTSRRTSVAIAVNNKDEVQPKDVPPAPLDSRIESPDISNTDSHFSYKSRPESQRKLRARSYAPTSEPPSTAFRTWLADAFLAFKSQIYGWIDQIFLYLHLHLLKIIFFALAVLCVTEVCAMHVPIMLLLAPGLLCNTWNQRIIVLLISTLISIYFMLKMIYQIDYVAHSSFDVNCTIEDGNNTIETYNNADWLGFKKSDSHKPLASILKGYIGLIATFTFYSLVTYRQQTIREIRQQPRGADKIMFPEVTRKDADIDLWYCTKYIINYGFYKFGVEVTLICLIGVIGSRMDAYAVLYALWLMLLASVKRVTAARVWPAFTIYVTILVPLQYLIAVGFMPQFCIEYPWSGSDAFPKHVRTFFFLPYTKEPPHASKLLFDFVLLLFASRQLRVFGIERTHGEQYAGGSNSEDVGKDWETPEFVNPVPDFLGVVSTWLNVLKRMVFLGMLWVTLAIMFLTGTNRVNLFSMGYLIGSFIFLWQGTDFYLRPKKAILQWWSWLLSYNVTVVVVKTLLQIPGCLYGPEMRGHACWVVQLLGIGCVDKFAGGNIARFIKMGNIDKSGACTVPQEDIGLAWDGVCFAFLILQRRLFHSYYFYRVIDESKATTVLASRGAELIEELRQKQMQLQEDQEVRILEKIKVKMERIKANQKKIQGTMTKEAPHHDHVPERPYRQPSSHQKAVRSGDYYMFDEFDDSEIALKEDDSSSDEDAPKEMGLGKLLSTAMKTDLRRAVSLRRASMPAMRQRPNLSLGTYPYSEQQEMGRTSPHDVNLQTERDAVSDLEDSAPMPETWIDKVLGYVLTARAFVSSLLVTITKQIMRFSRDYRYVSRALSMEKKILKEKEGFGIGRREGSQMIWEPLPETLQRPRKLSDISVPEIRILAPSMERGLDASLSRRSSAALDDDTSEHESAFSLQTTESKDLTILEEQEDSMFKQSRSPLLHLLFALWYMIIAHTDIACYIMVFINQIQSATILSIPLPMMVFLWGTLTIPRPTKTFWVTLIAYTEVIVLLKSMFQFEILPWNQIAIPDNMPFTAPRIIGIERKSNYALYDLLLLLIIFLHRFMLKSLGLWKESSPEVEIREDMEFPVTPEDVEMIMEGKEEEVGKKYVKLHDQIGPRHWLTDWTRHAQAALAAAARELGLPRRHPLVGELAWRYLQLHRFSIASLRGQDRDADSGEAPDPARGGADAAPEPGPSRAPDDDHYNVNDDQEPIIAVSTSLENKYDHIPKVLAMSVKRYLRPTKRFFERMLAPGARVPADVYAYMFLCDFLNFLVVIFGFAAFGTQQGDGGVQAYLEENKVPIPFLVMLILQFALIIIDRALYLRKFMLGKILFQYALIIGVHIWMFFVLPLVTERTFNARLPPPIWYMMKSIYLLLSAHQIRCGYPRRIIGNFLCKSYRFLNMVFFRCFMAVPFVFELRTLMDWIWTDTSMTLMDWLKMEDIFASVFLLKCSRYIEDEYPQPRGLKKSTTSKYLLGGGVLAFVIAIIWFPLVFFAFGNSVGKSNPPTDVTVKIRIGPFLPVYQMSAQSHNIDLFTEQDFTQLSNQYSRDRTAQTFLSSYMYDDVAVVVINPNSTLKWEISPPELARLEQEVMSNNSLSVTFSFVITHPSNNAQNPPTIADSREVQLPALVDGKRNKERITLLELLSGNSSDTWLNVEKIFPKFLKVFNKGTAKPAYQLTPEPPSGDADARLYRNIQLRLEREGDAMYWRVHEACTDQESLLISIPKNNCDMLVMYTFNDKLFPETLNFISGGGIIGLYTTFVFLASRVLRGFFSGIYTKIMFDDLPNVDRVLQLCLDIYLVREAQEMALEEDLFAKLVFLYRSPETMIKWTRPKDEDAEEQRALPPLR